MANDQLQERIVALGRHWRYGGMDDACYAARYFLFWQIALHGRRFASRKFKRDTRSDHLGWLRILERSEDEELRYRLVDYFQRYNFLGVIPNVTIALSAWLRGHWPLRLCEHIPASEQMLRMQAKGIRAVTVISEPSRLLRPILGKANAFAFMIHDLEHAYKFFHDPELYESQKVFFSRMLAVIEGGVLASRMEDPVFAEKFNYLIGDMNTHARHSLQYLRAILIESHLRDSGRQAGEVLLPPARDHVEAVMGFFGDFQGLDGGGRVNVAAGNFAGRSLGIS